MNSDEFKDLIRAISINVICSGSSCDSCKAYFKTEECPSGRGNVTNRVKIDFWKEIYEKLIKKIDFDEDTPFPRDDWGEDDIINIIMDKWNDEKVELPF